MGACLGDPYSSVPKIQEVGAQARRTPSLFVHFQMVDGKGKELIGHSELWATGTFQVHYRPSLPGVTGLKEMASFLQRKQVAIEEGHSTKDVHGERGRGTRGHSSQACHRSCLATTLPSAGSIS